METTNKYDYFEVLSALQKTIRRGEEENALFWAFELLESGYKEQMTNRLITIAYEDIGVESKESVLLALRAIDDFNKFFPKNPFQLCLATAIMAMCRAENKTRDADYLQAKILYERRQGKKIDIPDVALDKHTIRGKIMKRGVEHFIKEGCKLLPKDCSNEEYKKMAKEAWEWSERTKNRLFEPNKEKEKTNGTLFDFT